MATSGLQIVRAIHQTMDPALHEGSGTHRAWFEGRVESATVEMRRLAYSTGLPQDETLGMRRGIVPLIRQIVTLREDHALVDHQRSDGNFPFQERLASQVEANPHHLAVKIGRTVAGTSSCHAHHARERSLASTQETITGGSHQFKRSQGVEADFRGFRGALSNREIGSVRWKAWDVCLIVAEVLCCERSRDNRVGFVLRWAGRGSGSRLGDIATCRAFGLKSIGADQASVASVSQVAIDRRVDAIFHQPNGSVGEQKVRAARVEAPEPADNREVARWEQGWAPARWRRARRVQAGAGSWCRWEGGWFDSPPPRCCAGSPAIRQPSPSRCR